MMWLPVEHTRSEPIFEKRRIAAYGAERLLPLSGFHESYHPNAYGAGGCVEGAP
jgi:hypothetical protein